jgi:desulfoferrodoxin (superoxide reductase-like protein)
MRDFHGREIFCEGLTRGDFGKRLAYVLLSSVVIGFPASAYADVPTVTVTGPEQARTGEEFPITISVSHKGNNLFHHLNRIRLFADGKLVKEWTYSWRRRPDQEDFAVRAKMSVTAETVFAATSRCNLHGVSEEGRLTVLSVPGPKSAEIP